MSNRTPKSSNSVLYLALLCIIYFLITSNFLIQPSSSKINIVTDELIYVEIDENGSTTVQSFTNPFELKQLETKYRLKEKLKSGDRLIVTNKGSEVAAISGRKKIALGIPIGLNSASLQDLTAIPGIGPELGKRIINYRSTVIRIDSVDELDNIDGIGKTKLANIKAAANLD